MQLDWLTSQRAQCEVAGAEHVLLAQCRSSRSLTVAVLAGQINDTSNGSSSMPHLRLQLCLYCGDDIPAFANRTCMHMTLQIMIHLT